MSALMIDDCHCTTLRRAARRVTQMYDDHLAPSGLRATQFPVLMVIEELGEISVNDLGRSLDLDRTATGKALRALQASGYIAIERSATDGRARNATLTKSGKALLKTAKPLWQAAQAEFEKTNGRDQAAELRTVLKTIVVGS